MRTCLTVRESALAVMLEKKLGGQTVKQLLATTACAILLIGLLPHVATGSNAQPTPIPQEEAGLLQMPGTRAPCTLEKDNGTASGYWSNFEAGFGVYTYFDPEVECGASAYPFEITSVSFTLYDPGGYVWPVSMTVEVWQPAVSSSPCSGIAALIGSENVLADEATFAFPGWGTATLVEPICIAEPVYIRLQYDTGSAGSTPSIVFDDNPAPDTCDNWVWSPTAGQREWYDFWTPPLPGYPIFWADGESQSVNCGYVPCEWNPGDPYKMHYPQLPDTMGWDVEASDFLMLADDWRCTESGFVKDIHFWGSFWHGTEVPIAQFDIRIFSDIPASQSYSGYSMPGEQLCQRTVLDGEFIATPLVSESSEGWFDPFGATIPEDHNQYYRYDICLDTNWFYQEAGTVYWLGITAVGSDGFWGWKSSQSHWNDNAVWLFYPPSDFATWNELYDPITEQPLDLSFVISNGAAGDCFVDVAEADASGEIDIDDVVYLISYIFSGGPAPLPYGTVSGDADCSCTVDIDDVVSLIAFIFSGGNPPCTCTDWMATCGSIR
jgi:hypothetical protein